MTHKEMPQVTIYTDGGARPNPGRGGWGALLLYASDEQTLSGGSSDTTNNRMELTAVCEALEHLNEPHEVALYVDSQYVKRGITEWIDGWYRRGWKGVKNPELWQRLHRATQRHRIRWHWIRGHTGDPHNERVDQLATAEIIRLTGTTPEQSASKSKAGGEIPVDAVQVYIAAHYDYDARRGRWAYQILHDADVQERAGTAQGETLNRLVLHAAITALETLPLNRAIVIYTDNDYLINGMTRWLKGWIKRDWTTSKGDPVKNRDLWERLNSLGSRRTLHWQITSGGAPGSPMEQVQQVVHGGT